MNVTRARDHRSSSSVIGWCARTQLLLLLPCLVCRQAGYHVGDKLQAVALDVVDRLEHVHFTTSDCARRPVADQSVPGRVDDTVDTTPTHAVPADTRQPRNRTIDFAADKGPRARFTKYLTTILRLSHDNAKVTIDLRRTSNLPNILRRTQGFS